MHPFVLSSQGDVKMKQEVASVLDIKLSKRLIKINAVSSFFLPCVSSFQSTVRRKAWSLHRGILQTMERKKMEKKKFQEEDGKSESAEEETIKLSMTSS